MVCGMDAVRIWYEVVWLCSNDIIYTCITVFRVVVRVVETGREFSQDSGMAFPGMDAPRYSD